MNVAFVTTEYSTEVEFDGGLANYLYRVIHTLTSNGHYVEVFTLSEEDEEIIHDGIRVHRIRNRSAIFNFLNRGTRYKFKRTFRFLSLSSCLKRRLFKRHQSQPFDIIQTASCFACGLFLTFWSNAPVVTRVSSFEPLFRKHYKRPLTLDQRICEWLELLAIRRSDAVYAPSRFLANILKSQKGIQTNVIRPPFFIEANDLDDSVYKRHLEGKKYFLFFGSIGFLKGVEIIAQSLPKILSLIPEMHFVFVGTDLEGPHGLSMMEYIHKRAGNYRARIHYIGSLRHHQLYPVIKHCKAVVLPSLVDNFPNTMLEAMAFGRIVIGTKGTSFEEFIEHDVSGILIEPNNSKALSKAMERVWKMTDEERDNIGQAAQKRMAQLSSEITSKHLEQYFRKVLENRNRSSYDWNNLDF